MSKIIIEDILVPYNNLKRKLRIYLPENYENTDKRYPVIYMHDAQNLYDETTSSYGHIWDINSFMDKTKEDVIVVGIDNHEGRFNRLHEYSPWVNSKLKNNDLIPEINEDVGGLGQDYMAFMAHGLKNYIDGKYRTKTDRDNTSMIGSSMGGLISLYAGMKYPEIYSKIGAFSTAVWFAEDELLSMIKNYQIKYQTKWYLDIGTKETSNDKVNSFNAMYLQGTLKVHEAFKNIGVSEEDLLLVVEDGGIHNEKYWAKRFPKAYKFLYK